MPNVALRNYFAGLRHQWERTHSSSWDDEDLGDESAALDALFRGELPEGGDPSSILRAVERLGGDDEDARGALQLSLQRPTRGSGEEVVVLNDRLLSRLQNLERYLRRIGKVDEFHEWLAEGARDD